MADRVLTWHFPGSLGNTGTNVSIEYVMDEDYVATMVRLRAKTANSGPDAFTLDINYKGPLEDTAVSIFDEDDLLPALENLETELDQELDADLPEGGVVTIDLPALGRQVSDLTVHLELDRE